MVVAIDRIGRTWQDTVRSICELRYRGVKIRSLADAEAQWTRYLAGHRPFHLPADRGVKIRSLAEGSYLEADEGSSEAFVGQVLGMFAAWVADQELQSVKRRTGEGLELAREQGKILGPPLKFIPDQVETIRRMREGGASLRRIASDFECSPSTVLRRPAPTR